MDEKATPTTEPQPSSLSLLAKQTFGSEYHGEVKEPEPVQEPEGEGPEEPEGEEPEGEQEELAEGQPAEGEAAEEEEVAISSLPELAEHQEWDPEWINTLAVPVKVNGTAAEATISDLVANYQMNAAADQRLEDAKVKAKAQTEELRQKSEALEGQFAAVATLVESAEKLLNSETEGADLQSLRETDPAEYAAKVAELGQRRELIEGIKRDAVKTYQSLTDEQKAEQREQLETHLRQEQESLLEKLPEWRDDATAKDEKARLGKFLIGSGFTEQDVMGASDHRLILLARKAMLFDEGQKKVDTAKKRVAKVPKTLKPGAPKPQEQRSREKMTGLRKRLRNSKSTEGQLQAGVELLRARRGGR